MDICQLLDATVPEDKIIDSTSYQRDMQIKPGPFLNSTRGGELWQQTINGSFLFLLDRCDETSRRYYLLGEDDFCCTLLPQTSKSISTPHRHDYIELVCILDGELDFTVEGIRRRYGKGECTILNQNAWHMEGTPRSYLAAYLEMRPPFLSELRLPQGKDGEKVMSDFLRRNLSPTGEVDCIDFVPVNAAESAKALNDSLATISSELIEGRAGYVNIVEGHVTRILDLLQTTRSYSAQATRFTSERSASLVERAISYIQAQRRRITRAELSEELHYNGNYINDVFLKRTGLTIGSYITIVCMQEAANLLTATDLSVSEIASRLGYDSKANFYEHFKRSYGMTPMEYRRSIRDR